MRKDQGRIVKECLNNDEPVFALRGRDICAIPALESYLLACHKAGCSEDFILELIEIIEEFHVHQRQEKPQIPD
jgi:hypothetical protein